MIDAAGTWRLGDLVVNRLGFGAMRLPQTGTALVPDAVPRDRGQAVAVLRRAVELGVDHIDTAAFYFSALRSANELINSALSPYPDGLVIDWAGRVVVLGDGSAEKPDNEDDEACWDVTTLRTFRASDGAPIGGVARFKHADTWSSFDIDRLGQLCGLTAIGGGGTHLYFVMVGNVSSG